MSQMCLVCVAKLCGHGSQIDIWMRSDPLASLLQSAPLCQHPRSLWRPLVHMTRVEDISEAESGARVAEWAAQQG